MDKIECHDIHVPVFIKKENGSTERNVPIALESFKIQKEEDNTKVLGLELKVNPDISMFPLFSKDGRLVLIFYEKSINFQDAYNFYFDIEEEQNDKCD